MIQNRRSYPEKSKRNKYQGWYLKIEMCMARIRERRIPNLPGETLGYVELSGSVSCRVLQVVRWFRLSSSTG